MKLKPMEISYVVKNNQFGIDRDKEGVKLMEKLHIDGSWFEPMFYHMVHNMRRVDAKERKQLKEYSHLLTSFSFAFDGESKNPKLKLVEAPSSMCMMMRQRYPEFNDMLTDVLDRIQEVMDDFYDEVKDYLKEVNDEFKQHKGEMLEAEFKE